MKLWEEDLLVNIFWFSVYIVNYVITHLGVQGVLKIKIWQFSSCQKEVRPGVVVTAICFSLFPASTSLILGYRDQIWPLCLINPSSPDHPIWCKTCKAFDLKMKTFRVLWVRNHVGVFATLGPTLSSNSTKSWFLSSCCLKLNEIFVYFSCSSERHCSPLAVAT